jgi:hypothetical protein
VILPIRSLADPVLDLDHDRTSLVPLLTPLQRSACAYIKGTLATSPRWFSAGSASSTMFQRSYAPVQVASAIDASGLQTNSPPWEYSSSTEAVGTLSSLNPYALQYRDAPSRNIARPPGVMPICRATLGRLFFVDAIGRGSAECGDSLVPRSVGWHGSHRLDSEQHTKRAPEPALPQWDRMG